MILQMDERKKRMRSKKLIVFLSAIVLVFGSCAAGCSGTEDSSDAGKTQGENGETESSQAESGSKAGTEAALHSFEAVTLDGGSFTQEDLAQKDVTILNFWALTCPPCIQEMPELARFADSLPDNIQVVTVCLDGDTDTEYTKSILDEAGFEGTTLLTGSGDFRDVIFAVQYTPTTIFVDKDGNLVGDVIIGGQEDLGQVYTGAVNRVLKEMGKENIKTAEG